MLHSILITITCLSISLSKFGQEILNLFQKSSPEIMEANTMFLSYKKGEDQSCLSIYAYMNPRQGNIPKELTIIGEGPDNLFFSGNSCDSSYIPDDVYSWSIVTDNEGSVNPFLTRKHYVEESIEDIISIFHKFGFRSMDASWADNHIFSSLYVEHPAEYVGGEKRLNEKIRKAFSGRHVASSQLQGRIPIVGQLIVERDGTATFERLIVKSNDDMVNDIAANVCKEIASETFIPAFHRGIYVRSRFVVYFPSFSIYGLEPGP